MQTSDIVVIKNVKSSTNLTAVDNEGYNGRFEVTSISDAFTFEYSTTDIAGNYYEFNATYNFGPVQGLVSYGVWENETKTTTVSISKEIIGVGFTLSYISADKDGSLSSLYKDKEYVTLSAKKVF